MSTDLAAPTHRGTLAQQSQKPKPPSVVLKDYLRPHLITKRKLDGGSRLIYELRDLHIKCITPDRIDYWSSFDHALPETDVLESDIDIIRAALSEPLDRSQIASITAAMCDAIPTFDAVRAGGYLDALLFALEAENAVDPFCPAALAAAAYKLLWSERFVPEPQKVIETLREEQERLKSAVIYRGLILKARAKLESLIENNSSNEAA